MASNTPETTPPTGSPSNPSSPALMEPPAVNGSAPALTNCPGCRHPWTHGETFCADCGYVHTGNTSSTGTNTSVPPTAPVKGRYEIGALINEHNGIMRYRGRDLGSANQPAIVIVRGPAPDVIADAEPVAEEVPEAAPVIEEEGEFMPDFSDPTVPTVTASTAPSMPPWPGIEWEKAIIGRAASAALPAIIDHFAEGDAEYLIVEVPTGRTLWDAWDDSPTFEGQFAALKQAAEAVRQVHLAGAMFESLRPDIFSVDDKGNVRINNLTELLPLPVPANAPLRATLYTAPELVLNTDQATARANLYSFGAMIYSLFVGRELTEMDFDRSGVPKPFLPRFPDIHPTFGRLVTKTFCRDLDYRFPTDEAMKEDASGFPELIKTLEVCRRTLDNVHFEIAAWTTTGMIRTGNEDAFGLIHAMESRQDDLGESALLLLADGMGGYEAGEIAAALAIQTLRKLLLQNKMLAALAGDTPVNQAPFDLEACKKAVYDALKETNRTVFNASRNGIGKRGMGCTAEVVYLNGRHMVVGHVGDSRVYHLQHNQIKQVTRDQTLVNRLVELGSITAEEAETHPRRSELQQAIGGRAEVEPAVYSAPLKAGDWVLVCSDGLTNHINAEELKQMMQSEAGSAEVAARRLVNFVNIRGATDNSTVVVVRAT